MAVALPLLTADELDQFPNDGKRREIIGGVLFVAAAPSEPHPALSIASLDAALPSDR
jgi:hypothetical protein